MEIAEEEEEEAKWKVNIDIVAISEFKLNQECVSFNIFLYYFLFVCCF